MKKIAVITSTRAEYGLLKPVIQKIQNSKYLELQLVVTGTHLSEIYGNTVDIINGDGFSIEETIDLDLRDNTESGIAHSFSKAVSGFSLYLQKSSTDCVLLLGDRYEILAFAVSALLHNMPIAHIHGGEVTMGAIDESIRHSITKLSKLHFAATREYANRIIQMGESPKSVFNVGGLGVDVIKQTLLFSQDELSASLGVKLSDYRNKFIVTFHPETCNQASGLVQLEALLRVLSGRNKDLLVFTMPNADHGSKDVRKLINQFVFLHSNAISFESLGNQRYLSCLSLFDIIIGNSSSGILEAPTFNIATINLGRRQEGRLRSGSVIDCGTSDIEINDAVKKALTPEFRELCKSSQNPYGVGGASSKIIDVLERVDFSRLGTKVFFDLPISTAIN
tara:strand:+ start:2721 stop:3899 length:1179 start_codon:yes stop_codon:yes gene_type:complete